MNIEAKLAELGLKLPNPPAVAAATTIRTYRQSALSRWYDQLVPKRRDDPCRSSRQGTDGASGI